MVERSACLATGMDTPPTAMDMAGQSTPTLRRMGTEVTQVTGSNPHRLQALSYRHSTSERASHLIDSLDIEAPRSTAVRNVDGTSYGRYSTYNSSAGLYHVDTAYGHPGPYSGYGYKTYYAYHSDGYSFFEQSTTYNYLPGGGYPSYLVDHEFKQYSYADGSSLNIYDYFRSDSTHTYGGNSTDITQNETQTRTDIYGSLSDSFSSYQHTLSF